MKVDIFQCREINEQGKKDSKTWLYLALWKENILTVASVMFKNITLVTFLKALNFCSLDVGLNSVLNGSVMIINWGKF